MSDQSSTSDPNPEVAVIAAAAGGAAVALLLRIFSGCRGER